MPERVQHLRRLQVRRREPKTKRRSRDCTASFRLEQRMCDSYTNGAWKPFIGVLTSNSALLACSNEH